MPAARNCFRVQRAAIRELTVDDDGGNTADAVARFPAAQSAESPLGRPSVQRLWVRDARKYVLYTLRREDSNSVID